MSEVDINPTELMKVSLTKDAIKLFLILADSIDVGESGVSASSLQIMKRAGMPDDKHGKAMGELESAKIVRESMSPAANYIMCRKFVKRPCKIVSIDRSAA